MLHLPPLHDRRRNRGPRGRGEPAESSPPDSGPRSWLSVRPLRQVRTSREAGPRERGPGYDPPPAGKTRVPLTTRTGSGDARAEYRGSGCAAACVPGREGRRGPRDFHAHTHPRLRALSPPEPFIRCLRSDLRSVNPFSRPLSLTESVKTPVVQGGCLRFRWGGARRAAEGQRVVPASLLGTRAPSPFSPVPRPCELCGCLGSRWRLSLGRLCGPSRRQHAPLSAPQDRGPQRQMPPTPVCRAEACWVSAAAPDHLDQGGGSLPSCHSAGRGVVLERRC